jgi:hypothetical protein
MTHNVSSYSRSDAALSEYSTSTSDVNTTVMRSWMSVDSNKEQIGRRTEPGKECTRILPRIVRKVNLAPTYARAANQGADQRAADGRNVAGQIVGPCCSPREILILLTFSFLKRLGGTLSTSRS